MAAVQAQSTRLPTRLINFFSRYPPEQYSAKYTGITIPITKKAAKQAAAIRPPSQVLNHKGTVTFQYVQPTAVASTGTSTESSADDVEPPSTPVNHFPPNPFLPRKNFTTGRWAGAKIGLRRQAELVQLARKHGVEELLPPGHKSTAFKEQRLIENGLRVRGTGEGQKVKGHKWERTMGTRLEKRRQAMENMPALIRDWESKGHGRGWKKYPKSGA